MAVAHKPECQARYKEWQVEYELYMRRWPNTCRSCYGSGDVEVNDGNEIDFCPDCLGNEYCPRCGDEYDAFNTLQPPCPHCGWQSGEEAHAPYDPECLCEEG